MFYFAAKTASGPASGLGPDLSTSCHVHVSELNVSVTPSVLYILLELGRLLILHYRHFIFSLVAEPARSDMRPLSSQVLITFSAKGTLKRSRFPVLPFGQASVNSYGLTPTSRL